MSEERSAQELVIIKRGGGHEEEHGSHGLWKIAYADFMTALMAFFLVMWLVNAANKKTLVQVSTYFNPISMSDQVTQTKGVHPMAGEPEPSEGDKDEKSSKKEDGAVTSENAKDMDVDEQGMFRDPYGVLAKLSAKATTFRRGEDNVPQGGSKSTTSDVYSGGEGFRDPFDPDFRQDHSLLEDLPSDPVVADGRESQKSEEVTPSDGRREARSSQPDQASPEMPAKASRLPAAEAVEVPAEPHDGIAAMKDDGSKGTDKGTAADSVTAQSGIAGPTAAGAAMPVVASAPGADAAEATTQQSAEAKRLQSAIDGVVKEAKTKVPDIEVSASGEGILISLMDDRQFGMFTVGSAKPRPELVAVMEKIAGLIKSKSGQIIVRGHTDGRPYKSDTYDNWRLSTARAHMAYYMLVSGGIAETRFERVEGYADRKLKIPDDKSAASNRRIEILLKASS